MGGGGQLFLHTVQCRDSSVYRTQMEQPGTVTTSIHQTTLDISHDQAKGRVIFAMTLNVVQSQGRRNPWANQPY